MWSLGPSCKNPSFMNRSLCCGGDSPDKGCVRTSVKQAFVLLVPALQALDSWDWKRIPQLSSASFSAASADLSSSSG